MSHLSSGLGEGKSGKSLQEIDTGVIHGWDAGRITAYERDSGRWEVVWHSFRLLKGDQDQSLGTFDTKDEAVAFGWKEYDRRTGRPVYYAGNEGA